MTDPTPNLPAVVEPAPLATVVTVSETVELFGEVFKLAEAIARTAFVPKGLQGNPAGVAAAILTGNELGLGAMASLGKIHVIEGRPALAAELMRAIVLAQGHEIWLEESSNTKATLGGRRRGTTEPTYITWTIDDANTAGLKNKDNWRHYPRAMLVARATGELCRFLFPDVLSGISYTIEEVNDGFELEEAAPPAAELTEGRPDDAPAPKPARSTRKAPAKRAPAAKTAPASPPEAPPLPGDGDIVETTGQAEPDDGDIEVPDFVAENRAAQEEAKAAEAAGPVVPPEGGRRTTPAQLIAIHANEAGLNDDERHGVIAAYSGGRVFSGKDLAGGADVDAVLGILRRIKDKELTITGETSDDGTAYTVLEVDTGDELYFGVVPASSGQDAPTPAEEGQEAPDEAEATEQSPDAVPVDEEAWRTFLRDRNLRLPAIIRAASELAGDAPAPARLGDLIAEPELAAKVYAWAIEQGGAS